MAEYMISLAAILNADESIGLVFNPLEQIFHKIKDDLNC